MWPGLPQLPGMRAGEADSPKEPRVLSPRRREIGCQAGETTALDNESVEKFLQRGYFSSNLMLGPNFKEQEAIKRGKEGSTN